MRTRKDQKERAVQLISELVSMEPGYGIEMFDDLFIYRLEDGRFSVGDNGIHEKLFTDSLEAARYFEECRKRKKLGFEFEKNFSWNKNLERKCWVCKTKNEPLNPTYNKDGHCGFVCGSEKCLSVTAKG